MYRQPQNSNRVKSIKSKFENIENEKQPSPPKSVKNGSRSNLVKTAEPLAECSNNKQALNRQLSDPLKRNIKRTPAFRLEKNSGFQRNIYNRNTLFENKIKQFNSVVKSCDKNSNVVEKTSAVNGNTCENNVETVSRPMLSKSKSSHDFQYIRNKFDKSPSREDDSVLKDMDMSLLYTEPIRKSFRCTTETVKPLETKIDSIYNKSTLQLTDKKEFLDVLKKNLISDLPAGLTDSLKSALNKPLPAGPPPKKPPRTFEHSAEAEHNLQKNSSFLHVAKDVEKKQKSPQKTKAKSDPKYMLNKLENALKNNKLRTRRQARIEASTTSGEDSDDSLLFRSKSSRSLPKVPQDYSEKLNSNFSETLLGDFNCFNGISCTNSAYERVKEPNSSFFVDFRSKEPVYAEPCHLRRDSDLSERCKANRSSLYYMSTPVPNEDCDFISTGSHTQEDMDQKMEELKLDNGVNKQISAENSSLSSFTSASDLDSTPSPVGNDAHAKIRCLIETFETRKQSNTIKSTSTNHIYDNVVERLTNTQKSGPVKCFRKAFSADSADNTTRLEHLKNTLKMTLDRSFNGDINDNFKDSDSEKNECVADIVAKFQSYIKNAPKYCQPKVNKDTLFYCCLVIERAKDCIQIKYKFPSHVEIPPDIEHLCFPESPDCHPLDCSNAAQTYSLLITNQMGERTFGYCQRVLPEGSSHCLPLAYCILSKYRAPRFYKRILIELESRHGMQNKYRDELISQFYWKKFPQPGESIVINLSQIEPTPQRTDCRSFEESVDLTSFIKVNKTGEYGSINKLKKGNWIFVSENDVKESFIAPSYVAYEEEKTELHITLHPDARYEDTDLKKLHRLPTDVLLKIFSSLLLERKVILISSVISDLSSCVDSLQSVLYPFTWYHTFIPILPEALWDIVESPTPVICGVLSTDAIVDRRIENGIVVNLETGIVLMEEGDETRILSGSMQKVWKRSIALANKTDRSKEYVHSVYLADAYLQVFIYFLKTYKDFIKDGSFLKEDFIKTAKTKGVRRFLKMFTETCMFQAFVDTTLTNPESLADFDKKIEMYGSEESGVILDKLLDWKR